MHLHLRTSCGTLSHQTCTGCGTFSVKCRTTESASVYHTIRHVFIEHITLGHDKSNHGIYRDAPGNILRDGYGYGTHLGLWFPNNTFQEYISIPPTNPQFRLLVMTNARVRYYVCLMTGPTRDVQSLRLKWLPHIPSRGTLVGQVPLRCSCWTPVVTHTPGLGKCAEVSGFVLRLPTDAHYALQRYNLLGRPSIVGDPQKLRLGTDTMRAVYGRTRITHIPATLGKESQSRCERKGRSLFSPSDSFNML
jgi:hypothetical protein